MSKYSFDTKFSVLMKDPQVMEIVNDLCPEIMNHPMKNLALTMGFTPNMGMVVLSKIYSKEKIEEFRTRLEAIE
ncbi:MAG: hypothetical protein IJN68_01710 [Clostridia bacterium]|nr:hypothetical protein [Oscillospiraceae bacterium]MBQ7005129.1 hypothetical protein [Clostridia bacterium]